MFSSQHDRTTVRMYITLFFSHHLVSFGALTNPLLGCAGITGRKKNNAGQYANKNIRSPLLFVLSTPSTVIAYYFGPVLGQCPIVSSINI
ncbi:hypothetical protein K457DRAFT_433846 [Linnemannia elongata AG-77]|uniref:Uncharacterized protein n=1 Tax=Linnemannia elongata AG-77 TaxID=1314771 RepID=A0A197K258_9FUNG|nr:hypothetical protein K457DRAFT_433846 [Linnemannia elongata AG-77]